MIETKEYINIQTNKILDMDKVNGLADNAMLKVRPDLWETWDFEKNDELGFDIWNMTKGSHKKARWICKEKKCKSSYEATATDKIRGYGCSYCRGLKVNHTNSLASLNPELASEWHPTKNDKRNPSNVVIGSHKKVWWIGKECGHEWEDRVDVRNKGKSCSKCFGQGVTKENSLYFTFPQVAKLWHPIKNGEISSKYVSHGSNTKKYWWIGECGHEWDMEVESMVRYQSCPICSGRRLLVGFNDMWTTNPEQASLLANPEDGYKYMHKSSMKVDWKCPKCNKILKNKSINNVNKQGVSCEICNDSVSFGEKIIYQLLQLSNIKFNFDQGTTFSGRIRYDFIIDSHKTIVEAHGLQHYTDTGFHKMNGKDSISEKRNDIYKRSIAEEMGYKYLEIDCSKSDFQEIKKEIMNSEILTLLDIEESVFSMIDMSHSLVEECWNLWKNNGMKKIEISKKLGIGRNRVAKYIKLREDLNNEQQRVG